MGGRDNRSRQSPVAAVRSVATAQRKRNEEKNKEGVARRHLNEVDPKTANGLITE